MGPPPLRTLASCRRCRREYPPVARAPARVVRRRGWAPRFPPTPPLLGVRRPRSGVAAAAIPPRRQHGSVCRRRHGSVRRVSGHTTRNVGRSSRVDRTTAATSRVDGHAGTGGARGRALRCRRPHPRLGEGL